MTPERWQQVKNLVNSVLEQSAEDRAVVLQQSCAEDLSLRRGAEALLSFHEQATRNLANAPNPAQAPGKFSSAGTMSLERWQQIEQIFQSALELQPAERAAYLAKACGNDDELRQEVEALLVFQTGMSGLIQDVVHQAAGLLAGSTEKARFTPGMTVNKRYRIIGQLGKGGMGEVYRADDLKLGHPVALKFLTEKLSNDKAMLARFHSEVAMAHRVTHPNVCRVHDIGEVTTSSGKLHFLSMEYVDGEDLSSLLRRIGRLPADKAVEIANQLCAGIAAAHEAGVLHRDLKPANVMLDGKGRVRITDFGLAGFAEQIRNEEVFAGTPAYMSPEQFAGKEVTTKSDIYALGLVLYEIFTGKRVFEANSLQELQRLHQSSSPTNPSNWVKDIDPLVERVILRCLEKDPGRRLASAKQVADALPGGDPLAAALAMGETPSPEMVAASGQKTGLRPAVAVACLMAIIVGLIGAAHLLSRNRLIDVTPFENSPEVLSQKAREIIAQLGYPDRPNNTARGFSYDRQYLSYLQRQVPAAEWRQHLSQSRPAAIFFWHRESSQPILSLRFNTVPTTPRDLPDWTMNKEDDPPQSPGMVSVRLDMQGRLIRFNAVPSQLAEAPFHTAQPGNVAGSEWAGLLAMAGIDSARLMPTEPKLTPPLAFDARAAWTGTFAEQPDLPIRVEAAAWRGRPVYFEVSGQPAIPDQTIAGQRSQYVPFLQVLFTTAVTFFGGLLAMRNFQQGRGDIPGAFKLAVYSALIPMISGLVGMQAISSLQFMSVFQVSVFAGSVTGLAYIALEPYVRRRWPQSMISWSRVLAGRFRDPLVGRDVLVGILFGTLIVVLRSLGWKLFPLASDTVLRNLSGTRLAASDFVVLSGYALGLAVGYFLLLLLLRIVTRRDWLAISLFVLIYVFLYYNEQWQTVIAVGLTALLIALAVMRFGLVTLMITYSVLYALTSFPVTLDFSAWYVGTGLTALLAVLALAVFAFYTSLGGQKVFAGNLLEE